MKFCLSFLLVIFVASQLVYAGKDKKKEEQAPKKHQGKAKQIPARDDSIGQPLPSSSTIETPVGLTMFFFFLTVFIFSFLPGVQPNRAFPTD